MKLKIYSILVFFILSLNFVTLLIFFKQLNDFNIVYKQRSNSYEIKNLQYSRIFYFKPEF